ncbi:ATP-binding cassette sub-family G member 2 [Heterocephalus glaber]|uniref:ATP-binding cassette sub-family G member 2 n=1 Tax=Heterocephalus glaber TaxID=10181 RepID=A0AAX6PBX6_HETGA|nr:ATP-binding cassette sub-family G member 2 [Heterocephalus glaber]XP_021116712.1 ATP-binding cassette sub-family G member 2 [Heterocephalus glaber]
MCSTNENFFIPMLQRNSKDLPGMTPSDLKTCTEGAVLSFHNISYRVKTRSGFLFGQKTVEKEILSNMSGIMRPGLNAILGPPGAGKSLLLDVLAARKDPCGLSGDVLINGEPHPPNFKCYSGYVAQDDIMKGTLTVRENLHFSAALRLPTTMTSQEKNEKINEIIEELDLNKVADSKVGTEFGLSGVERKKTSIGMELITDPCILFLDEPTNGLDSSTAHGIFLLLKRMSKQGRTIIFSIHQPQDSIFKMFDSLTLLASRKLVFHGPASEAVQYFASSGYSCEPYNNPADFFLDVISGDSSAVPLNREEEDCEANETEELCKRKKSVRENLAEFYAKSSMCKKIKDDLDQLSGDQKKSLVVKKTSHVTPFCHQFKWIAWRTFKNLLGDPQISIARATIPFIVGVVIGGIFLGLRNHCTLFQNRASILFVLTIYQSFSFLAAVETFVLEKKLFMHEYISGYYRLSSYFFGKLLCDLLCRKLLPSIIFNCILYFMLGLKRAVGAFLIMMFSLMMVSCSAHFLALAIAAGQGVVFLTTRLMDIYFVFMMIFSGITVNLRTMAPRLVWLQYFSILYYGFTALQHNEFLGEDYCVGLNTEESSSCPNYVICTGEEFLTIQGIDLSSWGLWKNHVALACMMFIFVIIAYIKLFSLKKYS